MPVDSPKADLSALRINRDETESDGGRRKVIIYGSIAVVLLAVVALIVSGGIFTKTETVQTATVAMISPSQASAVLTASGYVVATRKAAVATKGTGRLEYLGVEAGSVVTKDQVIGRIQSTDIAASLQQAKASLSVAIANLSTARAVLENADSSYKRQLRLFKEHVTSQSDLDAAASQYRQALAQVSSNEAAVELASAGVHAAEVQMEYTLIRAPFDGTVLTKDANVGDVVTPFGAAAGSRADVVTLADMSSLDAEVDVTESSIQQIHVGQPCEITVDAVPDRRYKGVVHVIVPTADRSKATVLTKVDFLDRDARVLPEMSLKVMFLKDETVADTSGPKLMVPLAAVVTKGDKKTVFVVREEVVKEVPVVLGLPSGSGVEVKQGLTVGDKVVMQPSEKLKSGAKVKVAE